MGLILDHVDVNSYIPQLNSYVLREREEQRHLTKRDDIANLEEIELLRGGSVVSTFAGAFGGALRETRLTALLGYLIALEPDTFLKTFGFSGAARSVRLEHRHGNDRSDILIDTTEGLGVIEAKLGAADPLEQVKKYPARWRVLLTQYVATGKQRNLKETRYLRWQDLTDTLDALSHKSQNPKVRFVSRDLLKYLEMHRMIKQHHSVEIYAREINEPVTLTLFLKAHMYACRYEANSQLPEALYFAPHFGQSIASVHPGVRVGVSYVARIEQVEVVETWLEFSAEVKRVRGAAWWKRHQPEIKPLRIRWTWKDGEKRSFLFLSEPRLVFNPPVNKENLQKGKGWLSKRVFSFDDLFQAWGR